MKKTLFFSLTISTMLLIAGCSPKLKPLQKEYFTVTPRPLVVKGQKIEANFDVSIPSKWMNRKATLNLMPVLRYGSRELWGATTTLQGEKVLANNPIISYEEGGKHHFTSKFSYEKNIKSPKLYMTFRADVSGKKVDLPELLLADGVISTATLANLAGQHPIFASNHFQRIIEEKYEANIHFLIQQSKIRNSELKKEELKTWKKNVEDAYRSDNQSVAVEVQAYASPDGGLKLNERLSQQREKNTTALLKKDLARAASGKVDLAAHYTAQDWDGFKKYVEASNIQDKELILRVLSMYQDPEEREREIRNISVVFDQLATDILPLLRRSRLVATIETIGKSDQELQSLLQNDPSKLNIEEMLYAIELEPFNTHEAYLRKASTLFPNDPRSFNNLAAIKISEGKLEEASKLLDRADQAGSLLETTLNRALLAIEKDSLEEAETLVGNRLETTKSATVLGFLYLKQGDFEKAVAAYGDTYSNNAAIAQIMTQDYHRAMNTLDHVSQSNALTDYLRAIVAARQNDVQGANNFLSEALRRDATLRSYAQEDIEFSKVKEDKAFTLKL